MNLAVPSMKTEVRQKHQIIDTSMIFKYRSVAARTEVLDATNVHAVKIFSLSVFDLSQ